MYCRNCGKELGENQRFCPNCGTPQETERQPHPIHQFQQTSGQNENGNYHGENRGTPEVGPLATDRSILTYILLSIVTCGIYGFYFLYCMTRDVNVACAGDGENTPGLAQLIIFSLLTCGIYSFYWYYKLGNRLADNAPRYGMTFQENGTTVVLWCVIGYLICGIGSWIAMYILIKNTNTICGAYNSYVSRQG